MGKDKPVSLASFFTPFPSLLFKKGEIILRAGDVPQGVYCIEKGYVRLYAVSLEGKEFTFFVYKQGDFFPVVWSLRAEPSQYYFQALTTTKLKRASRATFMEFVSKNPDALLELTQGIVRRSQAALRRMEYLVFGNAYQRLSSLLFGLARQFGKKERKNTLLQVPLTHTDLANLLGLTRETISIEIKNLEKKGIVGYRKRLIVVKSLTRLHQESNLP